MVSLVSFIFSREIIFTFVFISSLPLKAGLLVELIFVNLAPANFRFVIFSFDKIGL